MAATIVITCPACKKKMKASDALIGKKIRCKGCNGIVPVTAPAAAKKAVKRPFDDEDEGPDAKYNVTSMSFAPRCPYCANELESDEAVICLICGYNTITRQRPKLQRTYANTPWDYMKWLSLAFFCAFVALAMVGGIIFIWTGAKRIIEDNQGEWWAVGIEVLRLWGSVFCLFVMFFTARFAVKRLFFHFHPPEREKVK